MGNVFAEQGCRRAYFVAVSYAIGPRAASDRQNSHALTQPPELGGSGSFRANPR